jgi:hypothetical protein
MAVEFGKDGVVSEEEYRVSVRPQAETTFGKPVEEWHDWDFHFLANIIPTGLDEALRVARAMGHREGVGAIALAAHQSGLKLRHDDPETAAQYAAIVNAISPTPREY